jgi:hypothetical protein
MRLLIIALALASSAAIAQTIAPPPMIIEPADADAFREIVESTIPPKYNAALIRWYTAILQRQQANASTRAQQAEMAKAAKEEADKANGQK